MNPRLSEQPESSAVMRFFVGNGGWNRQLNFRACSGFTPKIQLCSYSLSTFTDARQPPVSGAPTFPQHFLGYALSIIADTQAKLVMIVSNLGFDLTRMCVLEGIS
jgi:hypothetical protein